MALILVVLFLLGPLAEIYLLIQAGAVVGALPVVFACVATAAIGGVILRIQGLAAIESARKDLVAGRPPLEAISDGVFLLLAAPLLMTPGFITDAMGFALLTPPIRRRIATLAMAWLAKRAETSSRIVTIRRVDP